MWKEATRRAFHHPSCGFTLAELLVVVAVIAIQASLLFPVLSAAKAKALASYV